MSITSDPLFVAAEVQWRTENLSSGLPTTSVHRSHSLRSALGRVRHSHRQGRRHAARVA